MLVRSDPRYEPVPDNACTAWMTFNHSNKGDVVSKRIGYLLFVPILQADKLAKLEAKGFQVEFHSHARAILSVDFPYAIDELCGVLSDVTIPFEEIIAGGGGEAKGTQRLRRSLHSLNWRKGEFTIEKKIKLKVDEEANENPRESISHEIDHVREYDEGTLALEIEWNNKDPFF